MVKDLQPNTKYEFAIRLHIDQLSSPWSPVVYQSTFTDGNLQLLNVSLTYDFNTLIILNYFQALANFYLKNAFCCHLQWFVTLIFSSFPSHSSQSTPLFCESDSDWRGYSTGVMETPRWSQHCCDTLHRPLRLQTRLESRGMASVAKRR